MLYTLIHVRDTLRVPTGDVLIKCSSLIEHCENERGWGKSLYPFKQFIVVEEDLFSLKEKEKK